MLNKNSVRVAFAGLLLMAFSAPSPNAIASEADGGKSEVSGSAEGSADGGGVVTISVTSSVTTAGSDGGGGGEVTSSSSSSTEVTVAPVCYYKPDDTGAEAAQGIGKVKKQLDSEAKKAAKREGKRAQERHDKVTQQIDENFPDYESHKDDTQGRWYTRYCDASFYDPKNPDEFKNERKAFYEANWAASRARLYVAGRFDAVAVEAAIRAARNDRKG